MSKKTSSGIPLNIFYGNKDHGPGEFPFTSGIYPDMYRSRLWTMRQYAGFGSAEQSNERFKYLLGKGVSGLSVAFDLPTQTGYDSDHPIADGEIGKVGVPISSLADMEILMDEIPLEKVSVSMTINSTAAVLLAFLIVTAEKKGIKISNLTGTIQNDILKEYIARGTFIYPPRESMRIVTDIFDFCSHNMPKWNTISISGYHIREAGSSAAEELAFTFSNAIEYLQSAKDIGLDLNKIGKRVSFFFNSHNQFFEEIAKFRTARRMWANIMKNRFGVTDENAMKCRFHVQTAGSTLQAQQIENNIIRTSLQAASAVIGGTQSLHTNSKDEALSLPTEKSAMTALRTQQIIAHESGIADVADPLAGSYYIEELCDNIEQKANKLINEIDLLGGAVSAIEQGFQQDKISQSSFDYQKSVDSKEQIIVGTNYYQTEEQEKDIIHKINQSAISGHLSRLKRIKGERDKEAVAKNLYALETAAQENTNLMPKIIDAVKAYATIGEISDTLRKVFGEFS
tara:strand:- start:423 stop:1958 length:1536 start_codon:yes stop_codon:yes gene_type:complete